jgi:hypothetical protein
MLDKPSWYATRLRLEIGLRNHMWAVGWPHVESYGDPPVIVYAPEEARHGNFLDAAYGAILSRPEWVRRFDKIHAQGRALPRAESGRRWRELDSSMSSDALLMNVFCTPGVMESAAVRNALGVDLGVASDALPVFGWKARVPLAPRLDGRERFDRTEVDMRWGDLLVEAKLTEADFQSRAVAVVEGYRDFDTVFDRERLPRVELPTARRRTAVEFPEDYSQEYEENAETAERKLGFESLGLESLRRQRVEAGYASYQLIRNVLAAYASGCSFCVLHDARRPDLREAWFAVMAAVKMAEMRVRCKVMTWQEVAVYVPVDLQRFLEAKYGIVSADPRWKYPML